MLAVINLGGAAFEQGFDGTIGWSNNPQNGLRELSGGELDDARREANFYHRWNCGRITPSLRSPESRG